MCYSFAKSVFTAWNGFAAPLVGSWTGPGSPDVRIEVWYPPEFERSAQEALEGRLVRSVHEPDELLPAAYELAREIGFVTATTTRWGNLFRRHRNHAMALPRIPLTNGFTWPLHRSQSGRRVVRGPVVTA